MSQSCSLTPDRFARPRRLRLCLLLTLLFFAGCTVAPEDVPPVPDQTALDIVNRYAEATRSIQAASCRVERRFYIGSLVKNEYLFGSLVAARGGKVRLTVFESGDLSGEPLARMFCDGKKYYQETRYDHLLVVGTLDPSHTRKTTGATLPFRPPDVSRAVCIEPIPSNFSTTVTVRHEVVAVAIPGKGDGDRLFDLMKVPVTIVRIQELSSRRPLREILIDRRTHKLFRQVYYNGDGTVQVTLGYSDEEISLPPYSIPTSVDLFVGRLDDRTRCSMVIRFEGESLLVNLRVPNELFEYKLPAGVELHIQEEP